VKVGVPKETAPGERRVALVPETVGRLRKAGVEIVVQRGAGEGAFYLDAAYEQAGAQLVPGARDAFTADLVTKVQKPSVAEVDLLDRGSVIVAFLQPLTNPDLAQALARRGITAFSMDAIPRVTRAQPMDALSSQTTVTGYRAVLLAAASLSKFLPMLTTAAGTIPPAKVFVIGAGVAGLQAIATARRLGAVVEAFDTRPVVKEQVQSLGARFLEVDLGEQGEGAGGYAKELSEAAHRREQELLAKAVRENDVVITTALIPGRRAPRLITAEMVRAMRPGSVIVDLASEMGGNCELTEPGTTVSRHGVTIHGETNIASGMAHHASQMYSRNVASLLGILVKQGELALDFNDEIVKGTCITHDGAVVHGPTKALLEAPVAASS